MPRRGGKDVGGALAVARDAVVHVQAVDDLNRRRLLLGRVRLPRRRLQKPPPNIVPQNGQCVWVCPTTLGGLISRSCNP